MHLPRPDIFISATSADLAPMRDLVKKAVLDLGAHPIEQEHFAPAGKTVVAMLREKIAASHALIHLVGECYGAEDESTPAAREHRTYAEGRRSYTQLEHDLAKELRKPVYIFICGENFPYREHPPEPEEKRALQAAHRAQMLGGNVLFHTLDRPEEVREHILRLETRVRAIGEELKTTRTRLGRVLVGSLVSALLLGGSIWLLKRRSDTQALQLAAEHAAMLRVEKQGAEQMELVRAVLAKAESHPPGGAPGGESDALAAAQKEIAKERGLTLAQLRAQLTAAEIAATVRVRLARETKARAQAQTDAANQTERAALKDLGDAALANSKYPEATAHYRQAAALYDRQKEPLPWADAQAALARAVWRDGKFAESADVWQEVLPEKARQLGPEHPQVLAVVNELAVARHFAGDFAAAEPLYRRALEASARVLGAEHPETLNSIDNLANLLRDKGEDAAAEPLIRRALEGRERVLGAEHPETLDSLNNLACLLQFKGDMKGAEPLFRRVMETRERISGVEHPDTLLSANNLGFFLVENADYTAAEPLYRRVLAARERILGPEHPDTLASLNNLAALLTETKDYAGAEPLYRRALAGQERVLGREHGDTINTLANLGALLRRKGDYAEAEQVLRRALAGREKVLTGEHPEICRVSFQLALVLHKQGKEAEAKPLAWRAYRGSLKAKGADHERTREARELLIELGEKVE